MEQFSTEFDFHNGFLQSSKLQMRIMPARGEQDGTELHSNLRYYMKAVMCISTVLVKVPQIAACIGKKAACCLFSIVLSDLCRCSRQDVPRSQIHLFGTFAKGAFQM